MRKVVEYDSVLMFLQAVEKWLERNEAENNLMLGLLFMWRELELRGQPIPPAFMATVESTEGRPEILVLLNPVNLILAQTEEIHDDNAVHTLVSYMHSSGKLVPGVVGPVGITRAFALAWAQRQNNTAYVKMNQRIYRLDQVNPIATAPGKLVMAGPEHKDLVADWIYSFMTSIDEPSSREEAQKKANENIESRSLYIWQHEEYVSMAKKSRPTRNGVVISLVYTPPVFRNRGYASSCVASLSQLLLDQGYRFCSLYTDLANPTSNRIYSDIGYRPVQDSILYRFKD